ncbi:protein-L-isoaspartate O-methyltransferase family protein [Pelagibacterium montanilacus]|uniref:protein-L-isoaspartate O-methyltransferase family protein n=1 Tax=Pelagibacterium montanilacus TaxID=2185280 RepID=UPI000F8F1577|nr:protein-L-isoaspartate O-methyltransferase [Pelagibacterium montanilacus]
MVDFARARRAMVDGQLRTGGIVDWRILDVMNTVPREEFVPEARKGLSYIDEVIELPSGRCLPTPTAFARLVQLAELGPNDVVLDVGCGSGYSTAVLAGLCGAVVGLDTDEATVGHANDTLSGLDIGNAAVVTGALQDGVPREAPFDAIVIEGGVEFVPPSLLDQLKDGGRLVASIGRGNAAVATTYHRSGSEISHHRGFNLNVPALETFWREPEFVL